MPNIKAEMFNKKAEKHSKEVLENLGIRAGDVIADLGSGGGFFTFEFAKRTGPDGKVYAVDTDQGLLSYIQSQQKKKQLQNITTVNADDNDPKLPESCDLVFLRNSFHHIPDPAAYFQNLKKYIKPDGRVAIIDWKPGASHHGHTATEDEIRTVMQDAGFQNTQSFDFLEKQFFNIFALQEETL